MKDLARLKGKSVVQPSQDNSEDMVKKLEKESTVTCFKCHQEGHKSNKCPQPKEKLSDEMNKKKIKIKSKEYPYPHAKIRARARARNPQRVATGRKQYPYPLSADTRIPSGTPVHPQTLENQAHKHILIACKY